LTKGDLLSLAGVYTISFLGVMFLFAIGNLILKESRTELKRTYHAPVIFVFIAAVATLSGIVGNILIDVRNLQFFLYYFIPAVILVHVMVYQDNIARFFLRLTNRLPFLHRYILSHFDDMTEGKYVVFVHHLNRIHHILNYINKNETGWNIIIVHCAGPSESHKESFEEIKNALPILQKAGVFPHLNLKLVYKNELFGPEMIDKISKEFKVRKNRMLIGSIHHDHPYDYDQLGGVRIIF